MSRLDMAVFVLIAAGWLLMAWNFARLHANRVVVPPAPVIPPLDKAILVRFTRAFANIGISAAQATERIRVFGEAWSNAAPRFRPRSDTPTR